MSTADDEDFWANEDFIATIENVVKKAEEASAARHGGPQTQSAPTLHAFAIVPREGNHFRVGELGPSAHGLPHFSEFLGSRHCERSIAPSGVYRGTISGCRDDPLAEFQGIPAIVTPQHLGQQEVSFRSRSQHAQASVQGPHQSLREASMNVQPPRGDAGQQMAEKDGIISFLRYRVEEAEQQLDELRQRVLPQIVSHSSLHQQQDYEIIEGQRARAEKEQRLEHAVAETAALKDELEKLKNPRQAGAELKRLRNNEGMDVVEHTWSPPWMPERFSEAERNTTSGLQNDFLEDAFEEGDCLMLHEEFPTNMRTGGDGEMSLSALSHTKRPMPGSVSTKLQ